MKMVVYFPLWSLINIVFTVTKAEAQKRHYLLADNTGNKDHITNMIVGSSQLECSILVVSVVDGISHVAEQHLLIRMDYSMIIYYNCYNPKDIKHSLIPSIFYDI